MTRNEIERIKKEISNSLAKIPDNPVLQDFQKTILAVERYKGALETIMGKYGIWDGSEMFQEAARALNEEAAADTMDIARGRYDKIDDIRIAIEEGRPFRLTPEISFKIKKWHHDDQAALTVFLAENGIRGHVYHRFDEMAVAIYGRETELTK